MSVDVHQHLWPEAFVGALARRSAPPRLRGSRLELAEGASEVDLGAHALDARIEALDRDEVELAVVSLQQTLGIEALPHEEADELLDLWQHGVLELAHASRGRLAAFAPGRFAEGFAGASVPASALLDLERVIPLLDELGRRRALLFVHPGPAASPPPQAPPWWAAVADYTAQMQAAYLSWLAHGQGRWPALRVIFAILAGGGPFQLERLGSWGRDTRSTLHANVFFDTASYGRRALELCIESFGVEQLVYGSDLPVIDPAPTLRAVRGFGDSIARIVCIDNPTRLLA